MLKHNNITVSHAGKNKLEKINSILKFNKEGVPVCAECKRHIKIEDAAGEKDKDKSVNCAKCRKVVGVEYVDWKEPVDEFEEEEENTAAKESGKKGGGKKPLKEVGKKEAPKKTGDKKGSVKTTAGEAKKGKPANKKKIVGKGEENNPVVERGEESGKNRKETVEKSGKEDNERNPNDKSEDGEMSD
eukprot:TRINITY_DN3986_c0_g1_i1.p1 TRINITY_DN3986_c0_g1~~TRINITY_DN3986_c0_g1_i1.p1  ORF type:complete len:187 (-),score=66.87 TRINITY_DN3986_c0_g1_i1:702-1262(-)